MFKQAWYWPTDSVADVCFLQVYGLRPFRIPLRWDFMNRTSQSEQLYNGVT
jgi:hypothetical protein